MKRSVKRKTGKWLNYLRFSNLKAEIEGYGFQYSIKKFLLTLGAAFVLVVLAGYLYRLRVQSILIVVLVFLCTTPYIVLTQFRYMYEQQRFQQAVTYMEQMIYSFKKKPKIFVALQDALALCEGKMKEAVEQAIAYIEAGTCQAELYREGLAFVEREYACARVNVLHEFLVRVELQGGECHRSLSMILDDLKNWVERTYILQQERKHLKNQIIISLLISLAICVTTLLLLPKQGADITAGIFYQCSTVVIMILFLMIYMFAIAKLTGSWLCEKREESEKRLLEYYETATAFDWRRAKKKMLVKLAGLCMVGAAAVCFGKLYLLAAVLMLSFFVCRQPYRRVRRAKKKVSQEIEKKFPVWLRSFALNLQTENVQMSLAETLVNCPVILKKEIKALLDGIEKNPTGIEPYAHFMEPFDLPEIKSAAKMIYSLTEYGTKEADEQINVLIGRNYALLDKAEKLKNEDALAGIGMLILVPMVIASFKMMSDMYLLFAQFFTMWKQVM